MRRSLKVEAFSSGLIARVERRSRRRIGDDGEAVRDSIRVLLQSERLFRTTHEFPRIPIQITEARGACELQRVRADPDLLNHFLEKDLDEFEPKTSATWPGTP